MARVLFIDDGGDGLLDLALRAQDAGHLCKFFLRAFDRVKRPVGRGLVNLVDDWRPWMLWCDLCILGGCGRYMHEVARWKNEGVPVIGGTPDSAAWELDRLKGMSVFQRAGIPIPEFKHCRGYDEAINHVIKSDRGFAVKPCGDVADKSLSFVAKTAEELVWKLDRWKRSGKRFQDGFILQERIEGVEAAVGAWCGPSGFAEGWEENFEEKRLFAGALGPNCGEAGTVMRLVKRSNLADNVLNPLESPLAEMGYVGNVDVNCIIDQDGNPWPLEFTMRLGYPAINIELALHDGDPIEFLQGVAAGDVPKCARRFDEIAVGVVCAIPPYPFSHEKAEDTVGVPIWGVTPARGPSLHFCDVEVGHVPEVADGQLSKSEGLCTAGSYVLVATGTGDTVVKARGGAYRVLSRLTIPASPFWRNDIGSRLRGQLPELNRHGFAVGLRYA
jgi:phosphoribosylamine---glycine ligase